MLFTVSYEQIKQGLAKIVSCGTNNAIINSVRSLNNQILFRHLEFTMLSN